MKKVMAILGFMLTYSTAIHANAEVKTEDGFCKIERDITRKPWGNVQLAVTLNGYVFYGWSYSNAHEEENANYYALKGFAELGISGLCGRLPISCGVTGPYGYGVYLGNANFPVRNFPGAVPAYTMESALTTLKALQKYGICRAKYPTLN